MGKHQCLVCGFVYDPQKGDHLSGVGPGTSFEKLPADWRCPICRAGKTSFEAAEDEKAQDRTNTGN